MDHDSTRRRRATWWGLLIARAILAVLALVAGLIACLFLWSWIMDLDHTADLRANWPTATSECLVAGQEPLHDEELIRRAVARHGEQTDDDGRPLALSRSVVLWVTRDEARREVGHVEESDRSWALRDHALRLGLKRWAIVFLHYGPDLQRGISDTYDACGNRFH